MTGKQKLYFLLDAIDDARTITPSGQPILIDPTNDLNRKFRGIELDLLFTKLEKDEKVLRVLKSANRIKAYHYRHGLSEEVEDGYDHIELLPAFDEYFFKIQCEPEYQEFTGKRPNPRKNGEVGISTEILISDLQSKYMEIQDEKNDSNFYLKIASYGKHLNDNKISHPVLAQLYDDSQRQIADLEKAWSNFFKIWREYAKDLVDTADAIGVKDVGPLEDEIEEVRNFLNQPDPSFSNSELPRYYHPYKEIIWRFDKLGKKNVIAKKHLSDGDENIKLYPEYNKVEVEWEKFKRIREISVWWAHYQISRLTYGILGNNEEKRQYFKNDNEIDKLYKYEFEEVGKGRTPLFIKRTRFEEWVSRLHSYLIPRLEEASGSRTNVNRKYDQLLEEMRLSSENQAVELKKRYEKTPTEIATQRINSEKTKTILPVDQTIKTEVNTVEWPETFHWSVDEKSYELGDGKVFGFGANKSKRKDIFKDMTNKKGGWSTVGDLSKMIEKSENYVRVVVTQLSKRIKYLKLQRYIRIDWRKETNKPGACRIIPFPPKLNRG